MLPQQSYSRKKSEKKNLNCTYSLIFLVSLAGNTVIGIIVYNFLIVIMAMSDLWFGILLISLLVQLLYIDSWLIGGPLGQALCKLGAFLGPVHTYPDIFESATFSFRIQKFSRPHVAYSNRIRPSTSGFTLVPKAPLH